MTSLTATKRRSFALTVALVVAATAVAMPEVSAANEPASARSTKTPAKPGTPARVDKLVPNLSHRPLSPAPGSFGNQDLVRKSGTLQGPTLGARPKEDANDADPVFGAYQRGLYLLAFSRAIPRAEAGDTAAMTMLGVLYESGTGAKLDLGKAATWYGLAADRGDREAEAALGQMTIQGRGVKKDPKRAFELFAKAAEKDQPMALYNAAVMMFDGSDAPHDVDKAVAWLKRAAELGNIEAQYAYASLLSDPENPQRNPREAAVWMREAAMSGFDAAEIDFALMFANGRGVEKSYPNAFIWFQRSALRGNPIGRNRLARMYATGLGVDPDPVKAWTWHTLAKGQGLPDIWLETQLASLSAAERARAEAEAERIRAAAESFGSVRLEPIATEPKAAPTPATPPEGDASPPAKSQ